MAGVGGLGRLGCGVTGLGTGFAIGCISIGLGAGFGLTTGFGGAGFTGARPAEGFGLGAADSVTSMLFWILSD